MIGLENVCVPEGVGWCRRALCVAPLADWENFSLFVDVRRRGSDDENRMYGSAGFLRNGGAGVVVASGEVERPVMIECLERAAWVIASSFQSELHALFCGLEWLFEHLYSWLRAWAVSDSKSVLVRLLGCRGRLCISLLSRCSVL